MQTPPQVRGISPRRIGNTLLLATTLALAPPLARAELFLNMAADSAMMAQSVAAHMGMAAVSKSYSRDGRNTPARKERPDAAEHSRQAGQHVATREGLQIGSNRAISQEVRQRFRDGLVRANPGAEAAIDQALAKDWLRGYRTDIAGPNGLDARNLADVFAGYMIANWAIVHQRDTISPRSIAAVRQALAEQLREGAATSMGAPERQRAGETLIYQTTLVMANREALAKSGDAQRRRQVADHYRRIFQQDSAIDLATLDLTEQGFVAR